MIEIDATRAQRAFFRMYEAQEKKFFINAFSKKTIRLKIYLKREIKQRH